MKPSKYSKNGSTVQSILNNTWESHLIFWNLTIKSTLTRNKLGQLFLAPFPRMKEMHPQFVLLTILRQLPHGRTAAHSQAVQPCSASTLYRNGCFCGCLLPQCLLKSREYNKEQQGFHTPIHILRVNLQVITSQCSVSWRTVLNQLYHGLKWETATCSLLYIQIWS